MKTHLAAVTILTLTTSAFAHADGPMPSEQSLRASLANLSSYSGVRPVASCHAPFGIDRIVCGNKVIALMDELDSRAYVYAIENATKSEVDHAKVRDTKWVRNVRNKCATEDCIVDALIAHTNDSLGGESPYR